MISSAVFICAAISCRKSPTSGTPIAVSGEPCRG
jgi:hypothetical protein